MDPQATGVDPAYWVFGEITPDKWANLTVTAPGKIGDEYPKTFGHYHSTQVNETYHLISGHAVLILQKKHYENGSWTPEMVDEVLLVKLGPGDEVVIHPQYGHALVNTGAEPLLTYDDWRAGHLPSDYEQIEKLQGLAYYITEVNGQPQAVPNPRYKNLPIPIWSTPPELSFEE